MKRRNNDSGLLTEQEIEELTDRLEEETDAVDERLLKEEEARREEERRRRHRHHHHHHHHVSEEEGEEHRRSSDDEESYHHHRGAGEGEESHHHHGTEEGEGSHHHHHRTHFGEADGSDGHGEPDAPESGDDEVLILRFDEDDAAGMPVSDRQTEIPETEREPEKASETKPAERTEGAQESEPEERRAETEARNHDSRRHERERHSSGEHHMSRSADPEDYREVGRKKEKKKVTPLKVIGVILLIILIILGGLVGIFFYLRWRGRQSLLTEKAGETEVTVPAEVESEAEVMEDGTITYKGEKYRYRDHLTNILIMGTDRTGDMLDNEAVEGESSGQADTLLLVSIDTETGTSKLLSINRDSMVDVDHYTVNGGYVNTEKEQICLAYGTGDGADLSARNVCTSLSRLLYGVPVNAYAAVDLDAIAPLTDAVGGLEVTLNEDMSGQIPGWTEGATITLTGENAMKFVRWRDSSNPDTAVVEQSNLHRMERQKTYITAFMRKAVAMTRNDVTFPLTVYHAIEDYLVTDISTSEITYLSTLFVSHDILAGDMYSVPGEAVMGEEHVEYNVNNSELYPLILEIFYDKV